MSEKFLLVGLLSGRIYKICTLLSTDIVENSWLPNESIPWKALLEAARAAWADSSWYGIDDEVMVTG